MRRRRILFYVALALAVPAPAFALGLGGDSSEPPQAGSLDTHASLDSCGIFENQIVCKFDATYNQVAGADTYTASVTGPDGSVADYGTVGPGAASFWVPYLGDGTYTVQIQAWGELQRHKPAALVASDEATAGGGGGKPVHRHASDGDQPASRADGARHRGGARRGDAHASTKPPQSCKPVPPLTPPDTPSDEATTPATGDQTPAALLGPQGEATATLEAEADLPDYVTRADCRDRGRQPDGTEPDATCCPPPSGP